MQHQNQHSQQGFFTLYDTNAPPHMRAPSNSGSKISAQTPMAPASIWAPQPQVGDATWPRALEAFAQPNREDVFAPKQLHSAGVGAGAVGDGRASKPGSGNGSPDMRADSHVELLLRTLNLNSPEPQSIAVARSSPTTSIGAGSSSSASTGSGGRFSGRAKPAPPPLDLSFASASASMSSNSIIHSSSDSTSLSASGNISSNSNTSLQLTDDSSGSVPSMTSGSSVSMAYPQSPGSDYSPLSLSSALLTPLDSPGGALSYTPGLALGLHSPSSGHHLPSILHGHNTHASLSPGALFYKERVHQQQLQQQQGQQYPYDYLLDSPGRLPRGFGMGMGLGHAHSSPGSPHQLFQPLRSPAAPGSTPASASSRFLPLPPTPPSALSALPPYLGNGMHGGAGAGGQGSPLALGLGSSALFADGPGPVSPGSIGSNPTASNIGDAAGAAYYRFSANADALGGDWLRPDDGLGLAFGFAQQQQQQQPSPSSIGAGATLYRTGGSTFGAGAGAFAEEQPHQGPSTTGSGILRGGFVYEPQHQQHQHDQHQHDQQQHGQHQHGQHQHGQQQHQQETPLGLGLGHSFVAGAGSSGKGSWDLDAGSGSTTNAALGGTGATGAGSGGGAPSSGGAAAGREGGRGSSGGTEPINFLSLLHPASSPPYASFVSRIIKSADQQASIFLQQKLKVAGPEERVRIVDAICQRGAEMMMHRFGNWAVQRCLEAATGPEERCKIVACMRGRVVDLATNCYGCHVLQKALDCEEEEVRLLIVSELLMGDPAQTLVNKHASHVWSKIMELSWTPPAPPIFAYVNKSLKGKWAALACHETGSLVVQHAFENLEDSAKDGIVEELLGQGSTVFAEVAKNQWGAYCVQHILEHGSDKHRQMALDHLLNGLLEFATNEQGSKSVVKALKEGGKETLDRVVQRMCEPAKGARRAMVVDLALSLTGSQLIASVLPTADKDQRALLYDCIRGHIVTLRGCKTGSKVIWLFDRMRAYYGY